MRCSRSRPATPRAAPRNASSPEPSSSRASPSPADGRGGPPDFPPFHGGLRVFGGLGAVGRGGPPHWPPVVAGGMLALVAGAPGGESALLALTGESARRYPAFLAELTAETGHDLTPASRGTLAVAVDRDQLEALRRLHAFQRSL